MDEQGGQHDGAPQETDLWWGAYSGWTLLPSLLVCVALTGVIAWATRKFVEHSHVQWTFWALTAVVWLVQTYRWGWRVFGVNYRLTTRRLLIDCGHWHSTCTKIELSDVVAADVEPTWLSQFTNVGRVVVQTKQGERVALEGVTAPAELVDRLRAAMRR